MQKNLWREFILNNNWVKYQQQREKESYDVIDELLARWKEDNKIQQIVKKETEYQVRKYFDLHKTEIQVEVDKKSIQLAKKAIYDLF